MRGTRVGSRRGKPRTRGAGLCAHICPRGLPGATSWATLRRRKGTTVAKTLKDRAEEYALRIRTARLVYEIKKVGSDGENQATADARKTILEILTDIDSLRLEDGTKLASADVDYVLTEID